MGVGANFRVFGVSGLRPWCQTNFRVIFFAPSTIVQWTSSVRVRIRWSELKIGGPRLCGEYYSFLHLIHHDLQSKHYSTDKALLFFFFFFFNALTVNTPTQTCLPFPGTSKTHFTMASADRPFSPVIEKWPITGNTERRLSKNCRGEFSRHTLTICSHWNKLSNAINCIIRISIGEPHIHTRTWKLPC